MRNLEESIFWEVFFRHYAVRSDFVRDFATSVPSVSRAVQRLLGEELLIETGATISTRGRRPTLLRVNPDLAVVGGIEFDRDQITAVVTNCDGTLLGRGVVATALADPVPASSRRCREALGIAQTDAGLNASKLARIGVGHTGVLDCERGVCLNWNQMPHWRNIELAAALRETLEIEVTLDDRARAVALAQHFFSPENRLHRTVIYVQVGSGIGAGVFADGRILRGANSAAAELGHVVIDRNGPICSCGNRGCVEAFASTSAILDRVRAQIVTGADTILRTRVRQLADLTIEDIASAAKSGDPVARNAIVEAGECLGLGIANAIQILNPSLVVLAGKLAYAARELLMEAVLRVVQERCFETHSRGLEIRVAPVHKDAAAIGCALLASHAVLQGLVQRKLFSCPP
jgi:predicted NBD/HSP70 family sugar kinase